MNEAETVFRSVTPVQSTSGGDRTRKRPGFLARRIFRFCYRGIFKARRASRCVSQRCETADKPRYQRDRSSDILRILPEGLEPSLYRTWAGFLFQLGLREHNLCYELCRQVTSTISSSFLQSFPPGSNRQSADYGSAALPVAPEKHDWSFSAPEREQQDSNLRPFG